MTGGALTLETVLPVLWFGVIGFGVLMYVLLDGLCSGWASWRPSPRTPTSSTT